MDDDFERLGPLRWLVKRALVDPLANYLPARVVRGLLRFGRSELAAANWADPGGWRSMVISYHGNPPQVADRILVGGVMAKALRNRRRLTVRLLRGFIDAAPPPVHILCLGAGPGNIILEAMAVAKASCHATLVDLSPDAFEYGRRQAKERGLADRVRYIQGDVRHGLAGMLDQPPQVVKMIGLCEYLTDEQIVDVAAAACQVMPDGAGILFNNLTYRHGNDRFFRRVFGLRMIHRSVAELTGLMARAGFGGFEVHDEPLGVYSVIAGFKGSPSRAPGTGAE